MEQELGSIRGYCYSKYPIKIYTKRLKKNFEVPCMYFPPPISSDSSDTVSTYLTTYSLGIRVFHADSSEAYSLAENIAHSIRSERYLVPVLNPDGTLTGKYIRIKRCDAREIEDGVALLTLTWDSRYKYHRDSYEKMRHLYLNGVVKE